MCLGTFSRLRRSLATSTLYAAVHTLFLMMQSHMLPAITHFFHFYNNP